jgi:hydroxyacylglutathione hydrolase
VIEVHQFACLQDNYGFLARDAATGAVAAIDTPDADAIRAALAGKGWRLTEIWNTHWHPDHAGGNASLKAETGCLIRAPQEVTRLGAPIDEVLEPGQTIALGESAAEVLDVGGHTLGHLAFHFAQDRIAFVGDALFALGCGRLFEGTPAQMWASLSRLAALPDDTTLYCAHEYTVSNARFALSVEPENAALQARWDWIQARRAQGLPTVPMTLAEEKATNPFLRAPASPAIRARYGLVGAPDDEVFGAVRAAKDAFR